MHKSTLPRHFNKNTQFTKLRRIPYSFTNIKFYKVRLCLMSAGVLIDLLTDFYTLHHQNHICAHRVKYGDDHNGRV